MAHFLKITTIALAGLAASACATMDRGMERSEAVAALREDPNPAASHAHEVVGLTAVSYGDRWVGANLLEQAVDGHASVSSRFNLATGYIQTGRLAEAAALYRGLVDDGQYTWAVSRRDPVNNRAPRRFNVAEESARRLADIERRLAFAPTTSGGAFSATEAGTPVAAVVGGSAPRGRISDDEALRRDGIAP